MKQKIEDFLTGLEKVPDNIHAAFLISVGAVLVLCKHEETGRALMMSGAAIFSHKS